MKKFQWKRFSYNLKWKLKNLFQSLFLLFSLPKDVKKENRERERAVKERTQSLKRREILGEKCAFKAPQKLIIHILSSYWTPPLSVLHAISIYFSEALAFFCHERPTKHMNRMIRSFLSPNSFVQKIRFHSWRISFTVRHYTHASDANRQKEYNSEQRLCCVLLKERKIKKKTIRFIHHRCQPYGNYFRKDNQKKSSSQKERRNGKKSVIQKFAFYLRSFRSVDGNSKAGVKHEQRLWESFFYCSFIWLLSFDLFQLRRGVFGNYRFGGRWDRRIGRR